MKDGLDFCSTGVTKRAIVTLQFAILCNESTKRQNVEPRKRNDSQIRNSTLITECVMLHSQYDLKNYE